MDLNEIKAFIDAMAASGLAEMEVGRGAWTLRLARLAGAAPAAGDGPAASTPAPPAPASPTPAARRPAAPRRPAPPAADTPEAGVEIRAPLAGIVYLHAGPNEPAFVAVGAAVAAGATLCVVEAMKMFNPVQAARAGTVEAILVASGAEVEAGQLLMRIA